MYLAKDLIDNWKLLTKVEYKGFTIEVEGSYELEYNGFECIYLNINILDENNNKIKSYSYFDDYHIEGKLLIILPRVKYTKEFLGFKFLPVKTSIQEEYIEFMEKVIDSMKCEVDELVKPINLYKYNKEMTDGLPHSIFKKLEEL